MNRHPWLGLLLVLLVLTGGAFWYWNKDLPEPEALLPVQSPAVSASPDADAPGISHPMTTGESAAADAAAEDAGASLPALDESDAALQESLKRAFGAPPIEAFLIPDKLIRRIVATIDSLDSAPPPLKWRPYQRVEGRPVVQRDGDMLVLTAENDDRYDAYVSALAAVDTQALVKSYRRYYPLFQRAYEELGYPNRYFNDRVVQIIDHLLATPSVAPPIALVQPKALYEFADPRMEQLSWGRKVMIRIGQPHAETVKAKLAEIRTAISTGSAAPQ